MCKALHLAVGKKRVPRWTCEMSATLLSLACAGTGGEVVKMNVYGRIWPKQNEKRENQRGEGSTPNKRQQATHKAQKELGKSNWAFNYDWSKSRIASNLWRNDLQILHVQYFSFSDEDFERECWKLNAWVETIEDHVLENKHGTSTDQWSQKPLL